MPRGRKPDTIPSIEWKLHIKGTIAAQVELLLTDPVRKKPKWGARSDLTERLYTEWIAQQIALRKAKGEPIPEGVETPLPKEESS